MPARMLTSLLIMMLLAQVSYSSRSDPGFKEFVLNNKTVYASFAKSVYKGAAFFIHIKPHVTIEGDYKLSWLLRRSPCAEEYATVEGKMRHEHNYYEHPRFLQFKGLNYKKLEYLYYEPAECQSPKLLKFIEPKPLRTTTEQIGVSAALVNASATSRINRRDVINATATASVPTTAAPAAPAAAPKSDLVTRAWDDGIYLLVLKLEFCGKVKTGSLSGSIEITNSLGYLSAIDWPLLPFYGAMCILYILFGLLWFLFSAKYWREMLRIQFCISGVIFLGMLEKAVFYGEYQSINSSGHSVRGAVLFAELVSCVKRSVARTLVLIVCLGYGIVKPRLGNLQHRVIGIGLVYFIFAAVEGSLRSMRPRFDQSRNEFYATIPLAITDTVICWWIFSSLVQTVRNLRVRRNLVKLSLYRHFTNTLVFCVVSSVIFMAWTIGRHKFATCITAWRELWVDEAFWHLLFSVILFVIIVLWRPSQNNQRYAFTPLLDVGEESDDDDDVVMDNLAEGVKSRHSSGRSSKEQQQQQQSGRSGGADDDLKWVEDNIPQSLVESTLPSLLQDSDEEILTTKYEMSKME